MEVNEKMLEDLSFSMNSLAKSTEQYPLVIQDLADAMKANSAFLSKLMAKQDEEDEKEKQREEEEEMVKRIKKALNTMTPLEAQSILKQIKEEAAKMPKAGEEQEPIQKEKVEKLVKQGEDEEKEKEDEEKKVAEEEEYPELKKGDIQKIMKSGMEEIKKEMRKEFGWIKHGVGGPKLSYIQDENIVKAQAPVEAESYEETVKELSKLGWRQLEDLQNRAKRGEVKIKGFNA